MAQNWGQCKDCKYFSSDASQPTDRDEAACLQDDLAEFELRVSGASGCNAFEARKEQGAERSPPAP